MTRDEQEEILDMLREIRGHLLDEKDYVKTAYWLSSLTESVFHKKCVDEIPCTHPRWAIGPNQRGTCLTCHHKGGVEDFPE